MAKLLMLLMLGVLVTGCREKRPKVVEPEDPAARVAIAAVNIFHGDIAAARYSEVCGRAEATAFSGTSDLPCFQFLTFAHDILGMQLSSQRLALPVTEDVAAQEVARVALEYATDYVNGKAREHFEFRVAGGKATLTSYRIDSDAFTTHKAPK